MFNPDIAPNVARDGANQVIAYNATDGSNNVFDAGFHGTHVAGLAAAASDNGVGVAGVLGVRAKIIGIKVATDDSTNLLSPTLSSDALVNGIRWAADQGVDVINLSLGGSQDRPALKEAMQYAAAKGALLVSAAGNNGRVLDSSFLIYPAAYSAEIEGAVTVGSVDAGNGAISSFSNRSPAYVDLMGARLQWLDRGNLSTVPTTLVTNGQPYASGYVANGRPAVSRVLPWLHRWLQVAAALMVALVKSRGLIPLPRQIEKLFLLEPAKRQDSLRSQKTVTHLIWLHCWQESIAKPE